MSHLFLRLAIYAPDILIEGYMGHWTGDAWTDVLIVYSPGYHHTTAPPPKGSIDTADFWTDITTSLALHTYFSYPYRVSTRALGAVSIRKTVLPGMAIPMLKIRRPNGRLIFNMEIAIRR